MKKQSSETHGKVVTKSPTTLEQLWGFTGLGKYKTLDLDEYTAQLNDMNKSDLQTHARDLGFVGIDDIKRLKQTLINEFRAHVAASQPTNALSPDKTPSKETISILAEGR